MSPYVDMVLGWGSVRFMFGRIRKVETVEAVPVDGVIFPFVPDPKR